MFDLQQRLISKTTWAHSAASTAPSRSASVVSLASSVKIGDAGLGLQGCRNGWIANMVYMDMQYIDIYHTVYIYIYIYTINPTLDTPPGTTLPKIIFQNYFGYTLPFSFFNI